MGYWKKYRPSNEPEGLDLHLCPESMNLRGFDDQGGGCLTAGWSD